LQQIHFYSREVEIEYIKLEQCRCNDEKEKHTTTNREHIDGDRAQDLPRMYRHLDERITAENVKARDLIEIVPLACDIAETIFKLESEGLRALANKKIAQQQNISQN
jgi:hypothetical protein